MKGIAKIENFSWDIDKAVDCLKRGGIILYPTDTIWGIGCDARNSEAVKRIYELKKRADSKSLIVLVDDQKEIEKIVEEIPEHAFTLIESATEPLTIIFDKATGVSPEIISVDGSIGIRITKEQFSRELCRRLGGPLVSTSANISGKKSPAFFDEIVPEIKDGVDYIVSYRRDDTTPRSPSHIIKLGKGGLFKIIR